MPDDVPWIRSPGISGSYSEEGLLQVTVRHYTPTLTGILEVGETEFMGVPLTTRTFANHDGDSDEHGFVVTCSYEGRPRDAAPGSDENFELDLSFAEEPIETHPDLEALKKKYGGIVGPDGRIKFPETLPGAALVPGVGLAGGADGKAKKNPMFNLKTFMVTRAIYRRNLVRDKLEQSFVDLIGTVVEEVPDALMPTPKGRDWLVLPPRIRKAGNTFAIGDQYMLSAPGGWPPVHGLIERL